MGIWDVYKQLDEEHKKLKEQRRAERQKRSAKRNPPETKRSSFTLPNAEASSVILPKTVLAKFCTQEILLAGLKSLPFVGRAVEVIERMRERYELLRLDNRVDALERDRRSDVQQKLQTVIHQFRDPNLSESQLRSLFKQLKQLEKHHFFPALFDGLLNPQARDDLHSDPSFYGRFLDDGDTVDPKAIKIFVDLDKTRLLELYPLSFHKLVSSKGASTEEFKIVAPKDVWAITPPADNKPSVGHRQHRNDQYQEQRSRIFREIALEVYANSRCTFTDEQMQAEVERRLRLWEKQNPPPK